MRLTGWMLAILLGSASGAAHAADPPGLYIGAGLGRATVKLDRFPAGASNPVSFEESDTGWKVFVGIRPLPFAGAELEYVDLGHPNATLRGVVTTVEVPANAKQRGAALFGMAYLPLQPFDLYAKGGIVRLRTTGHAEAATAPVGVDLCIFVPTSIGCRPFTEDRQSTMFAWGAGAQLKLSAFALRADYERFNSADGAPNFLSVSLTWSF